MADWESIAGLVSALVALITWAPWYGDIFHVNRLTAPRSYRLVLGLTPLACLLFVLACERTAAATAVRKSGSYISIYVLLAAGALGMCARLFSFWGLGTRDDVLERRNPAALSAIVGALLGASLCIAGGNIGEGPGVAAVLAAGGTAIVCWFFLWSLAEILSGRVISERITIERDPGCAVRLAGLLAGNGAILGGAAAGNWMPKTFLRDFLVSAWPALALTVAAAVVERISKPRSSLGRSIVTASVILLAAVAWVLLYRVGIGDRI